MIWQPPALKIKPPEGAITQGLPEPPEGMMIWRNQRNRYVVVVCGYLADPEAKSEAWWRKATENMLQHEIDSEYLISFASRGGTKAFPWLSSQPEKFLRPASNYREGSTWKIPRHWHLIGGLDYGGNRNPTAFIIYAIDEKKNWHAIYEYYKPSHYTEIAEALLGHPLYKRLTKIVVDKTVYKRDQHADGQVFTSVGELLESAGIHILERSNSDRIAGLARCIDIFNQRPGEDRPSRFFLSSDCAEHYRELSEIIYRKETSAQLIARNASEDVEKRNDHSFDAMRYSLMSWDAEAEMEEFKPDSPFALSNIEEEIEQRYREEAYDLFN